MDKHFEARARLVGKDKEDFEKYIEETGITNSEAVRHMIRTYLRERSIKVVIDQNSIGKRRY